MNTLVQIKFGSHLYGTATETSDLDIKGVYFPSAQDILLQKVSGSISSRPSKAKGEKNSASDIDCEFYSPAKFLTLLAEGQTVALDMFFAPPSAMMMIPHPVWHDIKVLGKKLLTKKAASFVRYCSQQANKYGVKGSRIAAARVALAVLEKAEKQYGSAAKLDVIADELKELSATNELLSADDEFFEMCGKKAMFKSSIKSARTSAQKLVDAYGERALAAEKNDGLDWKALSHAVRIGHEAKEFLTSHSITFPRPEAQHLINIKQGKVAFEEVGTEIEQLLIEVEVAMTTSTLPESFDQTLIDNFIEKLHRQQVLSEAK